MKVCIIGSGYVGLVAGAGFAEIGHDVMCVDISAEKIDALTAGEIPIYEPGLKPLCDRNRAAGRLSFSTDIAAGIRFGHIIVIAVGTPEREDGSADLSSVLAVAKTIAQHMDGYRIVACKSTVPVGTNARVRAVMAETTQHPFDVVSNPEFLREGEAVQDFMKPPRVVIGTDSQQAAEAMRQLYAPLYGYQDARERIVCMDPRSAEMTKYAANAYLATRITFINEIANLCERVGANIEHVRQGMGMDPRIGLQFLQPGCGFGGSCFPKDVQAILKTAIDHEAVMRVLTAVNETNDEQKRVPFAKVRAHFGGSVAGKRVAIWGLAFKAHTDDVRESPAIYIARALLEGGAEVAVHDPIAMDTFRRLVTDVVSFCDDPMDALNDADALILVTAWPQYAQVDWRDVAARMRGNFIMDGRNLWSSQPLPNDLHYVGIGRGDLSCSC